LGKVAGHGYVPFGTGLPAEVADLAPLRLHDRGQRHRRIVATPSPEADLAVTERSRRVGHRPRMAGISAGDNRSTRTVAGGILRHDTDGTEPT